MRSKLRILGLLLLLSASVLGGCGPIVARPTEAGATLVSSTLTEVAAYELTVAAATPTPSTGVRYCTDWKTGTRMSYEEAVEIAEESECVGQGQLKNTSSCNEFTGTWWIDLDIEQPGCNPACVVRVTDKTAEINWRCTGVIPRETEEVPPTQAPAQVATPSVGEGEKALQFGWARVETVELLMLESFPVQINVVARGSLPDGCTKIHEIIKEREGNSFLVTIRTARPADAMCTQALVPFQEVISLDVVGLKAGKYTVEVNGVKGSFELSQDNVLS